MKAFNRNFTLARRVKNKRLGEILIENGIINQEQLDKALAVQHGYDNGGHRFSGEILVELGFSDEESIFRAFTTQYQFPYLPLKQYQISPETVSIIPEEVAQKHNLIPVEKIGATLTIAMSNPLDSQAIKEIEVICNCNVRVLVTTPSDIKIHIKKYYNNEEDNNAA